MGRAERPLEPGSGLVAAFAHELRLLRQAAGSPTYRALAQRTHYSVTSLSQAASGRCLPTLGVTRAFVAGCGGDVQEWERRWRQAAAAAVAGDEPGGRMPAPGSTTAGASSGWAVGGASTASAPAVSPAAAAGRLGWSWLAGRGGRLLGVPGRRRVFSVAALVVAVAAGALLLASGLALPGRARGHVPRRSLAAAAGTTASPAAPLYSATIGADCPLRPGTSARVYNPAPPIWSTGTVGGWTGGGCYGEFVYQAQPGASPAGPDYVEWTASGIGRAPAGCAISVFIADSGHSAGLARYDVSTLTHGKPHVIAHFTIDQGAHHGDWVGSGRYPVTGGWLRVDMHPQDPHHREVTASAINIYCPTNW